ncbi:MAG: hypothetical protein HXY42_05300 [Chloroflexi bacterium]|nr:hypothetical protein [Chloroflexota bacterium]
MQFDINSISAVLGVLGAYFAILLVLSVSVETILEPFSFFKGLRKQVNPDDVVRSVREWLPEGSGEAAKVVAIQTVAEKTSTDLNELNRMAKEVAESAVKALEEMGLEEQVDTARKEAAIKLAILRERYAASTKQRITILRTLSALIGIALAFALQINTFDILGSFFSPQVAATLGTPLGQIGGTVITGLAASAGSSFWHDMLGRVRNLKETTKQLEKVVAGNEE